MEFDLGNAIPKLQLLRDKQKTFAIECFQQVIDRGSVAPLRPCGASCTQLWAGEAEDRNAEAEMSRGLRKMRNSQLVAAELRAVCHNHTLDVTQLSKAMIRGGGWSW